MSVYDEAYTKGLTSLSGATEIQTPRTMFLRKTLFGLPDIISENNFIREQFMRNGRPLPKQSVYGARSIPVDSRRGFDDVPFYGAYHFEYEPLKEEDTQKLFFGEDASRPWSKAQKKLAALAQKRDALNARFDTAEEYYASLILLSGKMSVEEHGEQKMPLSFSKNLLSQTVTTAWDSASADIIGDTQRFAKLIRANGGITPSLVIGDSKTISCMLDNTKIQKLLDNRRYEMGRFDPTAPDNMGAAYAANLRFIGIGAMDVYSYDGTYTNDSGVETPFIPSGKVIICSPNIGYFGYTKVKGIDATGDDTGVAAKRYFTVYRETEIPVSTKIMAQSRFLPITRHVDSWVVASVLS